MNANQDNADLSTCDHCEQRRPDQYGLTTADGSKYGFCSTACLAVWVRKRFVECR